MGFDPGFSNITFDYWIGTEEDRKEILKILDHLGIKILEGRMEEYYVCCINLTCKTTFLWGHKSDSKPTQKHITKPNFEKIIADLVYHKLT